MDVAPEVKKKFKQLKGKNWVYLDVLKVIKQTPQIRKLKRP